MNVARLVFPALRWSAGRGFGLDDPEVGRALRLGVGGFLLFGGEAAAVEAATRTLRRRAERPLLFGADLERGAGQQFEGCTPLPPALALAGLGPDVVRDAARLTAREASALGVTWLFGPVADVAVEPANPIVGTRALGRTVAEAVPAVAAWVEGALEGGARPCLKHFPGHGRTLHDSHATLPTVSAGADTLRAELAPFRAGLAAGAPSVMTAHVAYPALDPSGRPATRSPAIVGGLLRDELGFGGAVATDALIMEGAGADTARVVVEAVDAGVDALLYPPDPAAAVRALEEALGEGRLDPARIAGSVGRLQALAGDAAEPGDPYPRRPDPGESLGMAESWAALTLETPPAWRPPGARIRLVTVDDDVGGPWNPPSREPLTAALRDAGVELVVDGAAEAAVPTVLAVFAEPRGFKGWAGLSDEARGRIRKGVDEARAAGSPVDVVLFGDPVWAGPLPAGVPVLVAWGGEALMQRVVAREVAGRRG